MAAYGAAVHVARSCGVGSVEGVATVAPVSMCAAALALGFDADAARLMAAADAAASASRLTGEDAAQVEREQASIAERLGTAEAATLRTRARTLTASAASAVARKALERIPVPGL